MDEKLRTVKPYGHLYTMNEDYWLLSPHPIVGDSWERDGTYRFLVVPTEEKAIETKGKYTYSIYGYARHVVTNSFTIEYMHDIVNIHIPVLDEIDVTEQKEIEDDEETDYTIDA